MPAAGPKNCEVRIIGGNWRSRRIRFAEDSQVWGQTDYWATPLEVLARGAGDCEDYVFAKYFTLRELGVAEHRLRMTYVRARIGGAGSSVTQAHMVLSYYPTPDAVPLVLDNLVTGIRPASVSLGCCDGLNITHTCRAAQALFTTRRAARARAGTRRGRPARRWAGRWPATPGCRRAGTRRTGTTSR